MRKYAVESGLFYAVCLAENHQDAYDEAMRIINEEGKECEILLCERWKKEEKGMRTMEVAGFAIYPMSDCDNLRVFFYDVVEKKLSYVVDYSPNNRED